jgi:putative transposase
MELLGISSIDALRLAHSAWVEEALSRARQTREAKWTESIAVGSRDFVETVKAKPGIRTKGRRISGMDDDSRFHEPQAAYSDHFNG